MVKGEKENREKQRGRKKKRMYYLHPSQFDLYFSRRDFIRNEAETQQAFWSPTEYKTAQEQGKKKNVEKNVPCVSCSALQMANEKKNVPVLSLIVKLSVALLHDEVNLAVMQF